MYQLGDIKFEGIRGLDSLKKTREAVYAELPLIGGKSRLQRTGTALQTLSIGISLHAAFTDPAADIAALDAYRESGEVLALITGEGEVIGDFLVLSIEETVIQTSPTGRTLSAELSVTLKEHFDPNPTATRQKSAVTAAFAVGTDKVVPVRLVRPAINNTTVVSNRVQTGASASTSAITQIRQSTATPAQQASVFVRAKNLLETAKTAYEGAKELIDTYTDIAAKAPQLSAAVAAAISNASALSAFLASGDLTNALTGCDTLDASLENVADAIRPLNAYLITRKP